MANPILIPTADLYDAAQGRLVRPRAYVSSVLLMESFHPGFAAHRGG